MENKKDNKIAWHSIEVEKIISKLNTTSVGLSLSQSADLLKKYGRNELPERKPSGLIEIFFRQFQNPLIYILAMAAVVSIAIGETTDSIFIFGVLLINAIIGGYQEWKAEKGSHALQKLVKVKAKVQRENELYEVEASELVPGDLVWLEAGMRVPADVRLAFTYSLEIDESFLTGESISVSKCENVVQRDTLPSERFSMAFGGSIVTRGRARGFVTETGLRSEVGNLAANMEKIETGKPPLIVRMETFVKAISMAIILFSCLVGLYSVIIAKSSILEIFMFIVALAVSAIPEGLPIAMTVALSIGTKRMSLRKIIVKKLATVEGLGSCTMIATDKTGTLTCNELTIRKIVDLKGKKFHVSGEGYNPEGKVWIGDNEVNVQSEDLIDQLSIAGALCNEASLYLKNNHWTWNGDPVDIAFLSLAHKLGHTKQDLIQKLPLIVEIPFETEKGYAATFHEENEQTITFVKGAPEKVFSMSNLSKEEFEMVNSQLESMAKDGLRVLALAKSVNHEVLSKSSLPEEPSNLTFLGLVGMIDPPRAGVLDAIKSCHKSGIHIAMITGDHKLTASAIGNELGILKEGSVVVTGPEVEKMKDNELQEIVSNVSIFARVTPLQKLRIVESAKKNGQFVAVTGDGINDAPALKVANIGVAMGKSGTDVAKEAADLIITDDNFSTVVAGIEEGRIAYDNIRKVIYLLISTGAGELVLIFLAVLFGLPIPLLPVQLLWLNLVTNGIQDVALAFEPGEDGVLHRSPRSTNEKIFNKLMIERTIVAALVIGVLSFASFWFLLNNGYSEFEARNLTLLLVVLFENVQIGNSRSEVNSAFSMSPLKSPYLLIGTVVAFLIHMISMVWTPMQKVLSVKPVTLYEFLSMLAIAIVLLVSIEIHKISWKFRKKNKYWN